MKLFFFHKRLTLSCCFILLVVSSIQAQTFLSFKSGYAFEFNKTATTNNLYLGGTDYAINKARAISYGAGLHAGLGVGFMLSENLGIQLAADYVRGTFEESIVLDLGGGVESSADVSTTVSQLQVSPIMIISTGTEGFNLYAKSGLLFPVMSSYDKEYSLIFPTDGTLFQQETLKLSTSMGLIGALGFSFSTNEKLSIFLEGEAINLALKPTSSELTRFENSGVDELSELNTYEKKVDYVEQINNNGNVNEARQALATPVSFSSFGINLGLTVYF